jgi:GNAT superfamily N-acetyltransferase
MTELPHLPLRIDRPRPGDRDDWATLYEGYATFYRVEMTLQRLQMVWGWINDPSHELDALVAYNGELLVGLAHFRPFVRPLRGEIGLFLDDLFVKPSARHQGVGQALLNATAAEARRRGCLLVRWITADDNYRARALYDQHAVRTTWITYDMAV